MTKTIPIAAISLIAAVLIVGTITPALAGQTIQRPSCNSQNPNATVWVVDGSGNGYIWDNGAPVPTTFDANPSGDGFIIEGTSERDVIVGSPFGDLIKAGKGNDTVCGLGGDDTLKGGFGDDYLQGDDGNDTIHGGHGDDLLFGLGDHDLLKGGHGNDLLIGGFGNDIHEGGHGNDMIGDELGVNSISGGKGTDQCTPISDCEQWYE